MKNYIVSLVMARTEGKEISLQNVVGVVKTSGPEEAYERVKKRAMLEHPGHNIAVRVIVEMEDALAFSENL